MDVSACASFFSACHVKLQSGSLFVFAAAGCWIGRGQRGNHAPVSCVHNIAIVPGRVHAIADLSTVHLSTGMALMCYNKPPPDKKKQQLWPKWPSGYTLLCCDCFLWMGLVVSADAEDRLLTHWAADWQGRGNVAVARVWRGIGESDRETLVSLYPRCFSFEI